MPIPNFTITNDRFVEASSQYSVKSYRALLSTYIVLHNTAGGSVSGSVDTLNKNGFGYHVIIDRDGSVYQMARFNRQVAHAGASNWRGWNHLNEFAVGVCLANYGPCYRKGGGFVTAYDSPIDASRVQPGSHVNGAGSYQDIFWEKYPTAQVEAALGVCKALVAAYPIRDIIRHDDVSIARKVDTGPALDLAPFMALVGDRDRELVHRYAVVVDPSDTLSVRSTYGVHGEKIAELENDETVYVLSYAYRTIKGKHHRSKWCLISKDGLTRLGFVNSDYLEYRGLSA